MVVIPALLALLFEEGHCFLAHAIATFGTLETTISKHPVLSFLLNFQ